MPVLLENESENAEAFPVGELQQIAERMLEILDLDQAELSLLLTDDARMRDINREHRQIDAPTDVLAFPQFEPEGGEPIPVQQLQGEVLGDVVVSLDTATRQGAARGVSALEETVFLLAHGLLHLMGYDHAEPDEEARMTSKTKEVVERVLHQKSLA